MIPSKKTTEKLNKDVWRFSGVCNDAPQTTIIGLVLRKGRTESIIWADHRMARAIMANIAIGAKVRQILNEDEEVVSIEEIK